MNKVVFIINSIQQQRCIKRIEDFIEHGYDVKVYGFSRKTVIHTIPVNFEIEIVHSIDNGSRYLVRLVQIFKALRAIFKTHRNERVMFYYFALDIAMISTLLNKRPYIYEESDLTHTSQPGLVKSILELIDKRIIRNSIETVFTSGGFGIYHFGNSLPDNISIIPNRLNRKILEFNGLPKIVPVPDRLRIGFVGGARYHSVLNFASVFSGQYPQNEFHFFGNPINKTAFDVLKKFPNVFFHGPFRNPHDLPDIYASIDLVLSTYDVSKVNVRYAEPNKIYEAMFFETPIIVSKGTFLSDKVEKLGIGFSIDPLNNKQIVDFIDGLTHEQIGEKINNCKKIPKVESIDNNLPFFKKLYENTVDSSIL